MESNNKVSTFKEEVNMLNFNDPRLILSIQELCKAYPDVDNFTSLLEQSQIGKIAWRIISLDLEKDKKACISENILSLNQLHETIIQQKKVLTSAIGETKATKEDLFKKNRVFEDILSKTCKTRVSTKLKQSQDLKKFEDILIKQDLNHASIESFQNLKKTVDSLKSELNLNPDSSIMQSYDVIFSIFSCLAL